AWFLLADEPAPSAGWIPQSGIYYKNGRPKPGAVTAFGFPFVSKPAPHGRHVLWGISPVSGTVAVQIRQGGSWRTFFRSSVAAHGIFTTTRFVPAHSLLRAVVGSSTSLSWRVG